MTIRNRCSFACLLLLVVLAAGGYFRASGLFRGLDRGIDYHPDAPKQVMMLENYLHGNYLQFYDSLFYDGYPYGLNRLDEVLIRAVRAISMPVQSFLNPERSIPVVPSRHELYCWGRILRVVYGLLTVLLIYAAVRKFGGRSWSALGAASIYALAPLGSAVSHSVTGDVGVDLFLAVTVWSLAGYATEYRTRWLWLCGLACGMAFSCKYHGALGVWMVAVAFALMLFRDGKKAGTLIRQGLGMAITFIVGVLAGTPALLIDPDTVWRNIRRNFVFIKNYGVSPEFLEQPFLQKASYGITHNMPLAMSGIGWLLMLLALLALVHAAVRYSRSLADPDEKRKSAVYFAMASFPFMALILSAGLKPEVQPFHFSFILPVIAVSTGLMLRDVSTANRLSIRWGATMLLLAALAASLRSSIREDFFWRRSEIASIAVDYSNAIFEEQGYASIDHRGLGIIKNFYAEPSTIPVFRNRPSGLQHPDAQWWLDQHQLPVPSVPLPVDSEWVFMNGPVFPRSDRMFAVPGDVPGLDRTVVFNEAPKAITLGLRTGRWPARFEVCAPGDRETIFMPPHSQRIIEIDASHRRSFVEDQQGDPNVYLVPLHFSAELGPVWVTILHDDREAAQYASFGPGPSDAAAPELPDSELEERLASLKYLQGTNRFAVPVEKMRMPGDRAPLAAGAYTLAADVWNTGAAQDLKLELNDVSGLDHETRPFETEVPPGLHEIRWRFEKSFAPYDALLLISAEADGLHVLSWNIKPGPQVASKRAEPSDKSDRFSVKEQSLDVTFPGVGVIRGIRIPDVLVAGTSFAYAVRVDLDEDIKHNVFHDSVIFLHVKDGNGRMVAALDFPLRMATMAPDLITWKFYSLPATGIEPGTYHLDGGIYNSRTRLRRSFEGRDGLIADSKRRYVRLTDVTIR